MTGAAPLEDLHRRADAALARRDLREALTCLTALAPRRPDDPSIWLKLAAVQKAAGDVDAALDTVHHLLSRAPRDVLALAMRAQLLLLAGQRDAAGEAFGRALANVPAGPVPPSLAPLLALAAQEYTAWQQRQADQLRGAVRQVAPLSPAVDRLITNALHLTPPDRNGPSHYCYPGLAEIGFHDTRRFAWIAALEGLTKVIAAELAALLAARQDAAAPYIRYGKDVPVDQWAALNHNPDWSALHLIDRGQVVTDNARHCPETMRLLGRMPQPHIPQAGPNAMFSLLAPGTHIPPHHGVTNSRLLVHLPLIVPAGCWFRVGEERRFWQPGTAWVFDDTVEHEAMNPSAALRVILIADVWHPDIPSADHAAIAAVIAAGAAHIHKL